MRLGTCLLNESRTLQAAYPELAYFCSATVAGFYSAIDTAEEWDINPPSEEKVVDRYGLAAIDLRSRLRDLASLLAAIQNMLEAERIAADLCGVQA